MTITFEKTWQFNINQSLASTGNADNDHRQLILAVKNSFIGFGTSPWEVIGSSDGVTAGYDAVDRWIDIGDIKNGINSNPRSWIILYQPGLNVWIIIGAQFWTDPDWQCIFVCRTLPLGGTVTSNPTASGQLNTTSPNGFFFKGGGDPAFSTVLHAMQSTDGKQTRIFVTDGASNLGFFGQFDDLEDVPPLLAPLNPMLASWIPGNDLTTKLSYNTLVRLSNVHAHSVFFRTVLTATTRYACQFATESTGAIALGEHASLQGPNGIDGSYLLTPMFVAVDAAGSHNLYGRVPDMWFGVNNNAHGTVYPATGPIVAVQFHDIVLPWPNTAPVLT